ncbi:MAG TPA: BTAD domain-containing putative transcriptional regulator [Gaiellaceae bacterium]|nr:BTAD domain-containing putative transcriptional regulator [Gaiellaceae bacterium]
MEFGVLGPLWVANDGVEVRLTARRHRAVVATLLLRRGRAVSADALIEALWGEEPPATAASVLRLYVSQVRRLLPAGRLTRSEGGYALLVEPGELDLDVLERKLARAAKASAAGNDALAAALYREARGLWRGPSLADLVTEPFAELEARRLDELSLQALELWAAAELELGHAADVLADLQAAVAGQPLREGLRRLLMLALYQSDRPAEALAVYRDGRRHLVEELGLEPADALRELERRIHRRDPALRRERADPAPVEPVRVPLPATPTVGRRRDIEALQHRLLTTPEPLITLVGPSGIGKTRVALEVARGLHGAFVNGVFFVELAALTDPALVIPTLVRALGLQEQLDRPWLESVGSRISAMQALIVLDSFEHVLDAAPDVAEMLRHAPDVKVLVTSTTLLRVSGETVVPVQPLTQDDARALFVQRADKAGVPATVTSSDPAIDAICARLEGSPLAIELAAPWLRTLGPSDLLARLGDRLELSGRSRDTTARHRSLRAALDWSFELLAPRERAVLLALSPFAGSFDLAAFEAVVAAPSLEALASLVDASLIQATSGRYRLLESVRDYAVEKAGGDQEAWRRHASYFTEVALRAEAGLSGPEQGRWLACLDREHDNLRAALDRLGELEEPLAELRLAAALGRFWYLRGHIAEGLGRLGTALDHRADAVDALSAKALRVRSALAVIGGDYALARELAEAALAQYRELDDGEGVARTLSNLGAILHAQGDVGRAAAILDESIERAAALGDARLVALAENNRGDVALSEGELHLAAGHFERSLSVMRDLGDTANVARALYNIGAVALEESELAKAGSCFVESLDLAREVGDPEDVVWCMIGVAALASRGGRLEDARRLLAAIDEGLRSIGAVMKPFEQRLYSRTREAVGVASAASAAALTQTDAVELARSLASTLF